jgi:thiamine-monophosphate kinase
MKEFDLIARLTRNLPTHPGVIAGPGDDCALLDLGLPLHWVVLKTDAVVEGIHFTPETPPDRVGHKAMARVLSDFAAAAATPTAALVTLALPASYDPDRIEALYQGICETARRWNVAIVGGETTTNPDRVLISISALGTVEKPDPSAAPAPNPATPCLFPANWAVPSTGITWISSPASMRRAGLPNSSPSMP